MDKLIVVYLIGILTIGTVLPTVHSDPTSFYSLGSQKQAPSGVNQPPVFGTPTPANGSVNNPISLTWRIPINDPESDQITWTIQCSNGQMNSGCQQTNGTKSLSLSGLAYSSTYKIWVNATDPTGSGLYTRRWYTFTTRGNNPPVFGASSPANGSTGNLLSLSWSIPINDPEGNTFSWTIQCSNKQVNSGTDAPNGTKTLVLSGFAYSTTYKIWVNATDPTGSGLYTRKWYTFTTKPLPPMKVTITKPSENTLYIQDQERKSLPTNTIIYGPITITANVTSEISIARVEFYIDGRLKDNITTAPYIYLWNPIIQFNGFSLKHTITVIAYDSLGNHASDELNVTKWRFHPLLFITGVASASRLLLHTTVRGLFFNVQQSMFTTSFYAIRIHFSTTGPFRSARGVINFRSCIGGAIIRPINIIWIGSFRNNIVYGTFTFLGDIHHM